MTGFSGVAFDWTFNANQQAAAEQQRLDAIKAEIGEGFFRAGTIAALGGSLIAQIGAYGQVVTAKEQLHATALTDDHKATLNSLGASQAKLAAQDVIAQARRTKGRYALRAAQEQASDRVSVAARGLGRGGSTSEVQASMKLAQRIDELTIDSNALRQSHAYRRRAVEASNAAEFARVSAANARRTAGALNPALAAFTQGIQGFAAVSGNIARRYS